MLLDAQEYHFSAEELAKEKKRKEKKINLEW
jgi:hypothetical protein